MPVPGVQLVKSFPGPKTRWNANHGGGLWTRRVTFKDFNGVAGTTGNLDITKFPGGMMIRGAFLWIITDFLGGAISALTLSAGTTGSAAAYIAATSAFSGAPKIIPGVTALVSGTFLAAATAPNAQATVRVQAVSTAANLTALTQGKADLFLDLQAVNVLPT